MSHAHFVRTPFNYDVDGASLATGWFSDQPSLTQQQFKDECDINTIVKQFGLTGKVPTSVYQPTYGDFTTIEDFQSALHSMQRATDSFMAMPANVRERFANDPARFVEFCSDARNADEIKALGLSRTAPPVPPVVPDPVTPTPTSPV